MATITEFLPAPASASIPDRLRAFPFARELPQESFDRLAGVAMSHVFPAGTHLLDEGTLCEALLLVERGKIRVYKTAPSGREITLYRVEPGESCLLGTACLLAGNHYTAQAAAVVEVQAVGVTAPVLRNLFSREPGVQRFVIELFSNRFEDLEVVFRKMDERLAGFLLQEAERSPGARYPVEMSHDEIGTHLGTAREVVSRLLSQFETEGLVSLGRRLVRVRNAEGLRRRTGGAA